MSRSVCSTQQYPLYDYLANKAEVNRDKIIDLTSLCATITQMSYDGTCPDYMKHYEEIAALIIHHDLISNRGVSLSHLPYEGKTMSNGKGIMHNFANFPPKLQRIIAYYVEDPVQSLRESVQ